MGTFMLEKVYKEKNQGIGKSQNGENRAKIEKLLELCMNQKQAVNGWNIDKII